MSDDKDFVVKDRRVFGQETPDEAEAEKGKPEADEAAVKTEPGEKTPEEEIPEAPLPEITFSTFIMSLNASALVNLGIIDDPGTGVKSRNLPLGKQTIDILGMLEEKTRGNVNEDEAEMLKSVLYDLRMLYVKEKG